MLRFRSLVFRLWLVSSSLAPVGCLSAGRLVSPLSFALCVVRGSSLWSGAVGGLIRWCSRLVCAWGCLSASWPPSVLRGPVLAAGRLCLLCCALLGAAVSPGGPAGGLLCPCALVWSGAPVLSWPRRPWPLLAPSSWPSCLVALLPLLAPGPSLLLPWPLVCAWSCFLAGALLPAFLLPWAAAFRCAGLLWAGWASGRGGGSAAPAPYTLTGRRPGTRDSLRSLAPQPSPGGPEADLRLALSTSTTSLCRHSSLRSQALCHPLGGQRRPKTG